MPTTLSPTEQLTAATSAATTYAKQQQASGANFTVGDYNNYLVSILPNYPDLEVARNATPVQQPGQPMVVDISPSFFVVPGNAPDNSQIITNNTGVGTVQILSTPQTNLTASQYQEALQASPDTSQGTAFDAALTDAFNRQQNAETTGATKTRGIPAPVTDTTNSINSAQSSGGGTNADLTAIVPNPGFVTSQNKDITAVAPNVGFNTSTPSAVEDAAGASGSNKNQIYNPSPSIYADQTPTTNSGVPSNAKPGEDSIAQNSVNITSSGKATGGTSSSTAGGGTQSPSSSPNSKFPTARGNILHNYVNNTYKISIFAVPTSNINATYNSGLQPGNESALLANAKFVLSDGGAGASGSVDRSFFPTDLSIDNVELETIVATDNRTRGTDVIRMKFEVIEPYTVNFLGRLQQVAVALNGNNANWSNTFFVMVIDFYGYDDLGKPKKIPGTTKYIPFIFVKMAMKVTSSGGRYTINAIPVHSLASTLLDNQIPFHVEIQAATIEELFQAKAENYTETTSKNAERTNQEKTTFTTVQNGAVTDNTTVTKGLQDALNLAEIQKCLPDANGTRTGQELPNNYYFIFDQKLLSATIADVSKFTEQTTAMAKPGDATVKQQASTGNLTIDLTKKKFNAQAGTKITDFINSVLSVSSYMTDQNTDSGHDSQTVNTWKITPSVSFGAVDKGTGFYQRTVTYHVTPYVMSGHDAPGFGQKTVDPNEIVKQYLYLYSGNNKDVLDVVIDYNMAFFEIRNAKPGNQKQSNDNPGLQGNPTQDLFTGSYDASTDGRFFKPKYHYVRGIANRQNTSATALDDKTIAVQNLMEKLYDNLGDMIKLDITIVGDPDWISQDATLYGPAIGAQPYIPGTAGSINFMRPAYFNFYFATPNKDYDDVSGIFDSNTTYSQFSGIFQVAAVTSSFSNGKFTQKLKNYRVRNQQATSNQSSRNDGSGNYLTQLTNPTAEPAKNSVVAGNPADAALGILANVTGLTHPDAAGNN